MSPSNYATGTCFWSLPAPQGPPRATQGHPGPPSYFLTQLQGTGSLCILGNSAPRVLQWLAGSEPAFVGAQWWPRKGVSESHPVCRLFLTCPPHPQSWSAGTQMSRFGNTLSFFTLFLSSCLFSSLPSPPPVFFSPSLFPSLPLPLLCFTLCPLCLSPSLSLFRSCSFYYSNPCTWQSLQSAIYTSYCQSGGIVVRNTNVSAIFPFPPQETSSDCGF